jgi:hypothetical protein
VLRQVVRAKGIPPAIYVDRHSIFKPNLSTPRSLEQQLSDRPVLTQVGRALKRVGYPDDLRDEPADKGRVEQRLWGTFQDRLASELRLAHTATLGDATRRLQAFLRRINRRFAGPAVDPVSAYEARPAGSGRSGSSASSTSAWSGPTTPSRSPAGISNSCRRAIGADGCVRGSMCMSSSTASS